MSFPRTIWVVRHAEREDNVNRSWRKIPGAEKMTFDNSPLSERGRKQARECNARFKKIDIKHCFASPFDRTIETASLIVDGKNIPVRPEPGLCEALYLCEKPSPGFWDVDELKAKFPLVDSDYDPVFTRHTLPKEGYGDDACVPRLRKTLERLMSKYEGDILLVGHGASIGAIHEVWTGDFTYVGQATVSKFVETSPGVIKKEYSSDPAHLSDKSNLRPW